MRTWRTAWRSLTAKAGLPGLRFHDLRHHCVTKLAEAGAPEETIMAIAGHVDRKMLDHYSHIRLEARRKAVALLDPKPNNPTPGEQTEEQPTGSRIN
jgi:integrase